VTQRRFYRVHATSGFHGAAAAANEPRSARTINRFGAVPMKLNG